MKGRIGRRKHYSKRLHDVDTWKPRQQRRADERDAQKRESALASLSAAPRPRELCAPGTHAYADVDVTPPGVEARQTIVICARCRRTFQQVLEESPADLALYRAYLEAEKAKVTHDHVPQLDGLPVRDCAGCDRLDALAAADPANL